MPRHGGKLGTPGTYGGEAKRVNLDTEGGHVLLLELASQVTLDEGGLHRQRPSVSMGA